MGKSIKILWKGSIGAIALMLLFSCKGDLDDMSKSFEADGQLADAYYTDFNITYSDSAELKVKITGKILEQYGKTDDREPHDIMKDSVHLWFYDKFKQVQSEMMADHAIRYQETEIMNAKGNVVVINKKGEKLNSERLTWNPRTKKIICDTTVVITKPSGQKIVGSSLVSDQNFENYKITKVSGELPFEREEAPE